MNAGSSSSPNLYFVGFMGTGKSLIGRRVARVLGMQFLDADHEIERLEGKAIREIFAEVGESAFRALERRFMEGGHPERGCVVSCGGGLVTAEGMPELLRRRGVVIVLFASPETILRRTSANRNRPLLDVADPRGRIAQLLAEREPVYLRAGVGVSTENRTVDDVVRHCVRIYQHEVRLREGSSRSRRREL